MLNKLFITLCALTVGFTHLPVWAYELSVQIEPPGTAGLVIDRSDSYFADEQDQPMAYFGGWDGWGKDQQGPAVLTFKTRSRLPAELNIVWFSNDAQQFWGGRFAIPKKRIMALLHQFDEEGFNRLVVSINHQGKLTLWLASPKHEIQLGSEWQAEKTTKNWQDFVPSLPAIEQPLSQAGYVAAQKNRGSQLPFNDEMFVLTTPAKEPVQHYDYMIVRGDGLTYCGQTNAEGETRRINTGTKPLSLALYGEQCSALAPLAQDVLLPRVVYPLFDAIGIGHKLPF